MYIFLVNFMFSMGKIEMRAKIEGNSRRIKGMDSTGHLGIVFSFFSFASVMFFLYVQLLIFKR